MRTAVDSSVLLDFFLQGSTFADLAERSLHEAMAGGVLIVGEVVWAEVQAHFATEAQWRDAIDTLGIIFEPSSERAASEAGNRDRGFPSAIFQNSEFGIPHPAGVLGR